MIQPRPLPSQYRRPRRRRVCRRDRALLLLLATCVLIAAISHSVKRDYSIFDRTGCGQADAPSCAER